jgi:tetratricopeptide (TPR) repeat protein
VNTPANPRRSAVVSALLAGLTVLLYWRVRGHEFLDFDDNLYVTENPQVPYGLTPNGILWAFTSGGYASNWHPLTWLSHMLDVSLFGLNSGAHHLVNVVLHAFNTMILLKLLERLTGAFWRSAMVAALFAWHPLHVESVAWLAERKDVLSTLFWLLTMWQYCRYTERPDRAGMWRVAVCFALGLLAKPMLVTLPCVLLLLDLWPLKRIQPWCQETGKWQLDWPLVRPLVVEKLPLFALVAGACLVTFYAQQTGGSVAQVQHHSLLNRLVNVVDAYAVYLVKMLWPMKLAVFYPLAPDWPLWEVIGAAVLLVGVSVAAFRLAPQKPYLLFGWLWYLGTLVPVIGFVQVGAQAYADRYTYIPLLGIFIAVVWGLADAATTRNWPRPLLPILAGVALGGCVLGTMDYLKHWKNSITLFEHALSVTRSNPIAHTVLGNGYDKLAARTKGAEQAAHYQAAIRHYQIALRMNPDFADGHFNLGDVLAKVGRPEEAETEFRAAMRLKPGQPDVYNNLGFVLAARKRYPEALTNYLQALKLLPNYTNAHNNIAVTLENLGRHDEAVTHYQRALELDPKLSAAHANYGLILARQGDMAGALPHFAEAAKLEPDNAQAQFHFGLGLLTQQQIAAALDRFRVTIKLRPDWVPPMHTLAWTLATHETAALRNGSEAVALAERTCTLTKRADPVQLDTLAAAYAESGRFAEAIRTAEEARRLTTGKLAQEIDARLQLYRKNQAHREAVR